MTVNVISDIHATINKKNGRVVYDIKSRFSKKRVEKAFNILYETFYNKDGLKYKVDKKTENYTPDFYYNIHDINDIHNKNELNKFLDDFKIALTDDFKCSSKDDIVRFQRGLDNIDFISILNDIKWWYRKTDIKIRYIKDYMWKTFYFFDPKKLKPADYLIIAGDLGLDNCYDKILNDIKRKTKGKFKKILHIAGNHDHWWFGDGERPDHTNFDRDYFEHKDGEYLFLGCTLWTPLRDRDMYNVGRYMNDYRYTPGNFSPYASNHQYEIQSTWLRNKIETNKDKKIIVFTHHQPFEELIFDDYKHSDVNAAYVVLDHSLDDINKYGNIKLWACGHTHQSYDGMLHNVHVVRNPIGYRSLYDFLVPENWNGNWYENVIEV